MAKRRRGTPAPSRRPPAPPPRSAIGRTRPITTGSTGGRGLVGPVAIVAIVVIGAMVVLGVGLFGSSASPYSCGSQLQPRTDATAANPIVTPDEGRSHVALGSKTEYASCPPASGPHYAESGGVAPLRPAFYDPGARIGPGNWVHNLEHGYVVALYRCTDGQCPSNDVLGALRQFVVNGPPTETATACGFGSKVLAARFDDMATTFALLAWDHVLLLDSFDPSVGLDFASRWLEQSGLPEGHSC